MEVVAAVGAISGIVDIANRSISALADIRRRFNETSLTIKLLTGHLLAVVTALDLIQALIEQKLSGNDIYYELTLNLDVALRCCKLLVGKIDDHIPRLGQNGEADVSLGSRVRLVMESKGIEDYLTRLDRQTSALNLVIATFNCRTILQQQNLLSRTSSRQAIEDIRDDSSSLLVLYDSQSFMTARTETMTGTSKLSVDFSFDEELLQHRAYKKTLRSLMRHRAAKSMSLMPRRFQRPELGSTALSAIDRRSRSADGNAFTFIGCGSGLEQLLWTLGPDAYPRYSLRERAAARDSIYRSMIDGLNVDQQKFMQYLNAAPYDRNTETPESLDGVAVAYPRVMKVVRDCASKYGFSHKFSHSPMSYFLNHFHRVSHAEYCPTSYDTMVWYLYTRSNIQQVGFFGHGRDYTGEVRVRLGDALRQLGDPEPSSAGTGRMEAILCTLNANSLLTRLEKPDRDEKQEDCLDQLCPVIKTHTQKTRYVMLVLTEVGMAKRRLQHQKDQCTENSDAELKAVWKDLIKSIQAKFSLLRTDDLFILELDEGGQGDLWTFFGFVGSLCTSQMLEEEFWFD